MKHEHTTARISPDSDWVNPSLHAWLHAQQMLVERRGVDPEAEARGDDPPLDVDEARPHAVNRRLSHTA